MPVRNEERFIARNLEAVLAQEYPPHRLEVLVADGRSDDRTREIVERIAARVAREGSGATVTLVDNPERIMPTGTNAALRRARGDVVVLLGGHAELPRDYLARCVDVLLASGADGVSGAIESVGSGPVGRAIAAAMSSPFGIGNSGFRTASADGAPVEVDTIPFPVFRRDVFERVGLYNPAMVRHQDYEFNYRVRRAGGRMLLLPGLRAVYHVRGSLPALWRQYWQYGVWKGRFLRRHPQSLRFRHLVPPAFVLGVAGALALALVAPATWPLAAALGGAYLAFVALGMAAFAARGRWDVVPWLPAVMVCLQFGYGLGVWLGLALPRVPDAPPWTPARAADAARGEGGN
uniref:Glycosyltransferase family 2 protein n=1 Tax=Eiseniibacteriota bacterium TaxID=2212470 RepID=A0A832I3R3_UNCEI